MHYHNSTRSTGSDLARFEAAASSQEEVLLGLFVAMPNASLTPSEAQRMTGLRCPITSVRRALSNLTRAGELEKTDRQSVGPFSRPEYHWRAAEKYRHRQPELF